VGIGSLLEDGIGDTIRVSLTENPEAEIPVAKKLAAPYDDKAKGKRGEEKGISLSETGRFHTDNFYGFGRRPSREIAVGAVRMGGAQTVRVVSRVTNTEGLTNVVTASHRTPVELLEWEVRSEADVEAVREFRRNTGTACLARVRRRELLEKAFDAADAVLVSREIPAMEAARAAKVSGKPLFLEAPDAPSLLESAHLASSHINDLVLSLPPERLHEWRLLVSDPWIKENKFPLLLQAPLLENPEERLLRSAALVGALLCDGLGDAVSIGRGTDLARDLELAYNILQGAGSRLTKTEFVSCPSCGRTLFDLQATTEKIKTRMSHLAGVKIAIMGCIVNGPGEMADADFGYVGGGPGKINLYAGKDCVEKGVPAKDAVEKLIDLIKKRGKWADPLHDPR
jgi:(E)-4-hydroxy-3-methylbut-2-enyl-diphosphate synthase